MNDFSEIEINKLKEKLHLVFDNVEVSENIAFPESTYYKPRNRYRADKMLVFLKAQSKANKTIIAICNEDISTTKGGHKDWGIMGLAHKPGNAAIVSTFRLSLKNREIQLYKVVLHELGHSSGLPHCENKTCIMRDAEGGNHLDKLFIFCNKCKPYLEKRGWKLKLN